MGALPASLDPDPSQTRNKQKTRGAGGEAGKGKQTRRKEGIRGDGNKTGRREERPGYREEQGGKGKRGWVSVGEEEGEGGGARRRGKTVARVRFARHRVSNQKNATRISIVPLRHDQFLAEQAT